MATKKKGDKAPKKMQIRYAVTQDGKRHRILREDGKYLYCEDTQLRHGGTMVKAIEVEEAEEAPAE